MKYIIFDLDGTLVDSYPGLRYSVELAIKRVFPQKELAPNIQIPVGPRIRDLMQLVLGELPDKTLDGLEVEFRHIYDSYGWEKSFLYPEVINTLIKLSGENENMLFIVTNKPYLPTKNILQAQEDPTKTYLTINQRMVNGYLDAVNNDGPEKLNMSATTYKNSKKYLETTKAKIDTALLAYTDTPVIAQGQ